MGWYRKVGSIIPIFPKTWNYIMKVKWSKPDFGEEEKSAAMNSLNNYIGANGPEVQSFEKEFASSVNAKHAIAVSNGTTALMVSLMCMREKHGDMKIGVPSFTFILSATSGTCLIGTIISTFFFIIRLVQGNVFP